ncbi:hypothetical protein GE21DRAFT_1209022, partial [Neurospora crassa]
YLPGYNFFDILILIFYYLFKRFRLIPGYSTYIIEDWGKILVRDLLLGDWGFP